MLYLREAYGPMWGFLYSWTQMWVAKSGSIATLATGFFYYLTNFFPGLDAVFYRIPLPLGPHGGPLEFRYGQLLAMALILSLAWLNYYGVKLGGNVQVTVTVLKVALIAFIIIAGLGFGTAHGVNTAIPTPLTTAGFFAALVAALWAYDGWNNVSMVASEVREPQRNLPRSLIGGTIAVIVIYLLANSAYFHVLTAGEVGATPRVASEMMRRILGGAGAGAVSVAAMISIFAALNGSILSGFARAVRRGPRRLLLPRGRARPSGASHPFRVHPGAERVGRAPGALRTLRTTFYLCNFRELDSVRHDHRGGDRASQKAARSAAPVSHDRLSLGAGRVRAGGVCFSTFYIN